MEKNLLHYVLRRLDEVEPPVSLDEDEVGEYPSEEFQQLMSAKILRLEPDEHARTIMFGVAMYKRGQPRPAERYDVNAFQIAELLCRNNGIEGRVYSHERGRLYTLGKREMPGEQAGTLETVNVFLSLLNGDESRFMSVCNRIRQSDGRTALVLAPQGLLVSPENRRRLGSWSIVILPLVEHLSVDCWALPWDQLPSLIRTNTANRRFAKESVMRFPTPRGAKWGDVQIRLKDGHTVWVRVGSESGNYNYTQMGMIDRRNSSTTMQWKLLYQVAENRGYLSWGEPGAHWRNKRCKYRLKRDLQRFFGIEGDPFRLIDNKKGWQARFQIEPD